MAKKKLVVDGNSLSLKKIAFFLNENPVVSISAAAKKKVNAARKLVEEWVESGEIIYGITTGFGEFANVSISNDDIKKLQKNLILSHSAGVGEPLPPFIVKTMMLLRLNALSRGHSGIRLSTLQLLVEMINNNIIPEIPSQGSVGSSGDLTPLSHLVLAMLGKAKVRVYGNGNLFDDKKPKLVSAISAFKKFGLKPIELSAKEGLALINGTQMMTAYAAYICIEAKKLIKYADIAASLSHEALRATDKAFDNRIHELRPFKGQITTAENVLKMIAGSEIRTSHVADDPRVQDSYSIRCVPQIHGASRDTIDYVCSVIEIELNSVNDNPLIFPENKAHIEGGNFHGQPVALAMDFMAIALAELANVSERRIERSVNGSLSMLPRFLTKKGGLNSGFMIAQYTAAALVSENKTLAHPASVDSIPTSANQEDHNSMGSIAARKCLQVLKNVENVIAIELLTGAQGIEFLKPLKCGKGTAIVHREIRKQIPKLGNDRIIQKDIEKSRSLMKSGILLKKLNASVKIL